MNYNFIQPKAWVSQTFCKLKIYTKEYTQYSSINNIQKKWKTNHSVFKGCDEYLVNHAIKPRA